MRRLLTSSLTVLLLVLLGGIPLTAQCPGPHMTLPPHPAPVGLLAVIPVDPSNDQHHPEPPVAQPDTPPQKGAETTPRPGARSTTAARTRAGKPLRARGKSTAWPWLKDIHIPWRAAFLPLVEQDGYAPLTADIGQALRQAPADGGWVRDDLPSIVLACDMSDPTQAKLVRALEKDLRFVTVAHLFNCFRLDIKKADSSKDTTLSLSAYQRDGRLVATLSGRKTRSGALSLLKRAVIRERGAPLVKVLPHVREALESVALVEAYLRFNAPRLIDARTGKLDETVANNLARARELRKRWRQQLTNLKKIALTPRS